MIVVDRKPVPIYEVECHECHSKIQYRSAEVGICGITCPVCGVSVQAITICPVRMEDPDKDTENEWIKQTVSGLCRIEYYKCPKCGAEDQIQAPYCRMCGKRLKECSIPDKTEKSCLNCRHFGQLCWTRWTKEEQAVSLENKFCEIWEKENG